MEIAVTEKERSLLKSVIGANFLRPMPVDKLNKDAIHDVAFSDFCDMFEQKGEFIMLYFGAHWSP